LVKYEITLLRNEQIYNVMLEFSSNSSNCELKIPTWIPGSYMIREFSKNIININSLDNRHSIKQINKNTWLVTNINVNEKIKINYQVFANDTGIRMAYLDDKRAFINGTSLFIYPQDMLNENYCIKFIGLNDNDIIATSLSLTDEYFFANNYYELIDSPFEIGNLIVFDFVVKEIPHKIALSGNVPKNIAKDQLIQDIIQICEAQINIFGGTPFKSYLFSLTLSGDIYTGLEHLNSTTLLAPYYSLPTISNYNNKDYIKLLSLISHEYFHTWNIKSIKPEVFQLYDLENENYTNLLWWFEGLTSYYDDYILYLSKIITQQDYLEVVLDNINNVYKYNGVNQQSLINSSLTAWIKYYRQDENSLNTITNYYIKGALFNNCLDLYLRSQTNGKKSLSSVLRYMWDNRVNNQYLIKENDIFNIIYTATGIDCTFLEKFISNTDKLPLDELFKEIGIELVVYKVSQVDKKGLLLNDTKSKLETKIDLGCKLIKDGVGYKVICVYDNSLAKHYGIIPNDLIIALDNLQLTNLELQLNLYNHGDTVIISLFRHGKLINMEMVLDYIELFPIHNFVIKNFDKISLWL
jgi:predicted metalloprotease with PDZ domain